MTDQDALVERAKQVKARHEVELMALPGVVGVGIGLRQRGAKLTDEVAIVVMAKGKRPDDKIKYSGRLPTELEGVPVDIQIVGDIQAK